LCDLLNGDSKTKVVVVGVLLSNRRDALLDAVQRHGSASIIELASEFGVSSMTIRRDIELLAEEGLVVKVRGGVTAARTLPAQHERQDVGAFGHRQEKEAVARLAATLVKPGMSVGLSAGSTTWFVAQAIRSIAQVTVVTNSLAVADLLADDDSREDLPSQAVVLTGGVRTPAGALVGPVATRALSHLHCDVVFVSVHGIDPRSGFTTPNLLEAETDRALLATGLRKVIVADHSKWGTVSLTTIADLDAVDTVVIDDGLAERDVAELRKQVTDVRIAALTPMELADAAR
jgi:DeoR/GlpR family transcriptional regulator of sugar metabolism